MTTHYEIDADEAPSEAVVMAAAETNGRSPLELEVLAETIDPDSLDSLVGDEPANGHSPTVRFRYGDLGVTVTSTVVRIDG